MQQISDGIPALNLPDVCTNSPIHNKAFCEEHCLLLQNEAPDVPIDLRQFLKYCGAQAVGNLRYSGTIIYLHDLIRK